jgi:hypothetical protein
MASDVPSVTDPTATASADLPIACSLTDADQRARGDAVAALFRHIVRTRELPDGYIFAFPPEGSRAQELLDFVFFERACCPFLTFEVMFPSPHEVVWLRLRGGAGVKEFVRASFASRATGGLDSRPLAGQDTPADGNR